VARIETGVPARALLERFHRMLRARDTAALTPWIADSETSLRIPVDRDHGFRLIAIIQSVRS
jgi:hypothetical protein